MDKQAAVRIIKDTFESPFDKLRFVYFIKNLLNKIDETKAFPIIQGNYIPESFHDYVKAYERIGTYTDPANADSKIDVLIVHLQKETTLERARTSQRNFVARYLKDRGEKEAGLVAFVSPDPTDWRFSLVKMEYHWEGGAKIRTEFTPARRWSFLVGKNESSHTAQSQLVPVLRDDAHDPTLKQLEASFNIEVVTKEFFTKYRGLYDSVHKAIDALVAKDERVRDDFAAKAVNTVDFSKKLLGQIVFLYFVLKKGWLGVPENRVWGDGDRRFLRTLFENCRDNNKNFFNDYLEYLFYDALSSKDRGGIDPSYYSRFNCKIPFLNGGLFDPINNYNWVHVDIPLDNKLFSNNDKTKEGDVGTGILDVFDRYNFTVKEDEPLEKEVAIDPEMLGKVFENMLEVKDRKSKGTYYTPREIVHYMCQESLINYLDTAINTGDIPLVPTRPPQGKLFGKPDPEQGTLKAPAYQAIVPRADIEAFVRMGELAVEKETIAIQKLNDIEQGKIKSSSYKLTLKPSIRENARLIDDKLNAIRVCDPAVGSGAFLVGMMTEIVRARNVLTTYIGNGNRMTKYKFKRRAIQNCLYGIDIDPGAVEIAKLRLWLSLIVDEEDIKQIQPLPNLDYKIVCGNSLLGFPFKSQRLTAIEQLKQQFFNETDHEKKAKLKYDVDQQLREAFASSKKSLGYEVNFDFEILFSEVFHEKGGFDVVVANPPYIKEYVNRKAFDGVRDSPYYQGKMDIWYLFACQSIDHLRNNGILTFIAQNNWVTSYGASKLRNKVISDTRILALLDFGDYKIFEISGIQTMVMIFRKDGKTDNYKFDYRRVFGDRVNFEDILALLNHGTNSTNEYLEPTIKRSELLGKTLSFSASAINDIVRKIENQADFYLDAEREVAQGIVYPQDKLNSKNKSILGGNFEVGDGIFVLSRKEKQSIPFSRNELSLLKPCYTTEELHKWYGDNNNKEWVIYTDSSFKHPSSIKPYPNIKAHLDKFRKVITSDNWPYGLHRARDERFFKGEKIIVVRKCAEPAFTYTDFDCYVSATFYVIKTERVNLKYLTAILNSKLVAFWLRNKGKMQGNNYQIDKEPLLAIPICRSLKQEHVPIIALVDQILLTTKNDDYTNNPAKQAKVKELECQIDQSVYELYGLTPEEIAVVEGSNAK